MSGMTKYLNCNFKRKKNKKILFVGIENRIYPSRFYPGPLHHNEMKSIDHFLGLVNNKHNHLKKNLFYLPNRTILSKHRVILSKSVSEKQIIKNLTFKKNFQDFSLIICSSPMTTFFDSILSGPTIVD